MLPDGSALIAETNAGTVARIFPDGRRAAVGGQAGGGVASRCRFELLEDISGLPDGSFLVAAGVPSRVRRVYPRGTVTTVAGGGSGWRGGAPATTVDFDIITSVQGLPDGRILVRSASGSPCARHSGLRISSLPDGRMRARLQCR